MNANPRLSRVWQEVCFTESSGAGRCRSSNWMGGPGTGRVRRHELIAVPVHAAQENPPLILINNSPLGGSHFLKADKDPPVSLLQFDNGRYWILNSDSGKNGHANAVADGTSAKKTMSSSNKHRRGFESNDAASDFRRFRRVKARQQRWVFCLSFGFSIFILNLTQIHFPSRPSQILWWSQQIVIQCDLFLTWVKMSKINYEHL